MTLPDGKFSPAQTRELELVIASALGRAFRDMGLDQDQIYELRKDLTFLREWRETCELIRTRSLIVFITLVIGSAIGALWLGFKGYFVP